MLRCFFRACVAFVAFVVMQAEAARAIPYLVHAGGTLNRSPLSPGQTAANFADPFGPAAQFDGFWLFDVDGIAPTFTPLSPPGSGNSVNYFGAVVDFVAVVSTQAGQQFVLTPSASNSRTIFIIDNGAAGPNNRIDQFSLTNSSFFTGTTLNRPIDSSEFLGPDVFVASTGLFFTQIAPNATPPTLLTSELFPDDPALVMATAANRFFNIQLRSGTATTLAELQRLPVMTFSATVQNLTVLPLVTDVPEPVSGLLLATGLAGLARARRRKLSCDNRR